MTERSREELIYNAHCAIRQWGRHKLTHAEATALLDAYLEAQTALYKLGVETKRLTDDAAAQRALVERLTNELDQHQKGHA